MASGTTARRKLIFPKATDAPKVTTDIEGLANQLDNDVEGGQGTLAARPAAALRGRVYMVQGDPTPANNGVLWWDTGATWITANGEAVTPSTISAPTGLELRAAGAEILASATRPALVIGYIVCTGAEEEGVTFASPAGTILTSAQATNATIPFCFPVAPNKKYKWTASPKAPFAVWTQHVVL